MSIKVNNVRMRNSHLFVGEPQTSIPDQNGTNVMYFPTGIDGPAEKKTKW